MANYNIIIGDNYNMRRTYNISKREQMLGIQFHILAFCYAECTLKNYSKQNISALKSSFST